MAVLWKHSSPLLSLWVTFPLRFWNLCFIFRSMNLRDSSHPNLSVSQKFISMTKLLFWNNKLYWNFFICNAAIFFTQFIGKRLVCFITCCYGPSTFQCILKICLPSASVFKLYWPMMNSTHVHILVSMSINLQWIFTGWRFLHPESHLWHAVWNAT